MFRSKNENMKSNFGFVSIHDDFIQNCRKNMKESSRPIFPFGAHGGCACQGLLGLGVPWPLMVYKLIHDWCQFNIIKHH